MPKIQAAFLAALLLSVSSSLGFSQEIFDATLAGDADKVAALLKEEPYLVDAKDAAGFTPLMRAVEKDRVAVAKVLLEKKADVNGDFRGGGMLQSAVAHNHAEMARLLLAYGADTTGRDLQGLTPLHWAAFQGNAPMVALLLAANADVTARDGQGGTPLHSVFGWRGHAKAEIVEALLAHHADVNASDNRGWTPLRWARETGENALAQLLREHGAHGGRQMPAQLILDAAQAGNARKLEDLLDADPGLLNTREWTHGWTPLFLAAIYGQRRIVELLLAHKADVDAKDADGRTLLHEAALRHLEATARLFLDHHAAVDTRDKWGRTPLHVAAEAGNQELAEAFLAHGADINAADDQGETPLHAAVQQSRTQMVEFLLSHDAAVDRKDKFGKTPAGYAREKAISNLLRAHGAKE